MPPYIPAHSTMVLLSGIVEMVAGLLILNTETQSIGAWILIATLMVFFTVHIYMLQDEKAAMNLPQWILWLRLPLQIGLIYWVYQYV